MQKFIENGAGLVWLIDLQKRRVEVYRSGQTVEGLENLEVISGENILPTFILKFETIWH